MNTSSQNGSSLFLSEGVNGRDSVSLLLSGPAGPTRFEERKKAPLSISHLSGFN
jgi:hypothetical protein